MLVAAFEVPIAKQTLHAPTSCTPLSLSQTLSGLWLFGALFQWLRSSQRNFSSKLHGGCCQAVQDSIGGWQMNWTTTQSCASQAQRCGQNNSKTCQLVTAGSLQSLACSRRLAFPRLIQMRPKASLSSPSPGSASPKRISSKPSRACYFGGHFSGLPACYPYFCDSTEGLGLSCNGHSLGPSLHGPTYVVGRGLLLCPQDEPETS